MSTEERVHPETIRFSLEQPFDPSPPDSPSVGTEEKRISVPRQSHRVGLAVAMLVIAMGGLGLGVRTLFRDWKGLSQELEPWVRVLTKSNWGKSASHPPSLSPPDRTETSKAIRDDSQPERGHTSVEGDRLVASKAPPPGITNPNRGAPEVQSDPTEVDPIEEIEREARARNEQLNELDRIKRQEAEELAKRPPDPRNRFPRGMILPPQVDLDIVMREQLAQAEQMMREMLRHQQEFFAGIPEQGDGFGPGVEEWPPRGVPRLGPELGGMPGADARLDLDGEFERTIGALRQFELEMRRRAGGQQPGGAQPRVRRWEQRTPNGIMRGFEIRLGG
jgi:hypothetical protein